jgi:hypothetical protein
LTTGFTGFFLCAFSMFIFCALASQRADMPRSKERIDIMVVCFFF